MAGSRKLIVEIVGDSKSFEKSLARSISGTQKFGQSMKKSAVIAGAAIAAIGAGAAVGITKSVQAASNLAEQLNKANVVFGRSAKEVSKWSETTANSFGISQRAALEAAGTFGNLFSATGLAAGPAAEMSQRLVELAADLASFNNIDPTIALEKLRSGLTGEAEPLRAVGILLSEARVQQEAYAAGIAKPNEKLTEAEKVQARYNLILKDSTKAQGDFTRTSDSLANATRRVSAQWENAQASLGRALLPVIAKAATALANFIPVVERGIGRLGDVVGPAVARFVGVFTEKLPELRRIAESILEPLRQNVLPVLRDIATIAQQVWARVVEIFSNRSDQINKILSNLGEALTNIWKIARPTIVFLFTKALPTALNIAIPVLEKVTGVTRVLSEVFVQTVSFILRAIDKFLGGLTQITDAASHLPFVGDKFAGVSDKVNAARESVRGMAAELDALDGKRVSVAIDITTFQQQGGAAGHPADAAAAATKATDAAKKAADNVVKKTGPTAAQLKKAADKQRAAWDAYMDSLSLRFDKAQAQSGFKQDLAIIRLQLKAVDDQIKVEGRTTELLRKRFDLVQERARIRGDITAAEKEATDKGLEAAKKTQARIVAQLQRQQFRAIGLGPEGGAIIPGAENLRKQLGQLSTRIAQSGKAIPAKLITALEGARKVLAGKWGEITVESRQAINDLFAAIRGEFDKETKGPLTKTTSISSSKLLEGLGLGPEAAKELRRRVSRFNTAGMALAGTGQVAGFGGVAPTGQPIIVHTTVNLDGERVGRNVTKHQQKASRRNPPQKRGPNVPHGA